MCDKIVENGADIASIIQQVLTSYGLLVENFNIPTVPGGSVSLNGLSESIAATGERARDTNTKTVDLFAVIHISESM